MQVSRKMAPSGFGLACDGLVGDVLVLLPGRGLSLRLSWRFEKIPSLRYSLVALKILLGLSLLSYSALRQAGMDAREAEDAVNDFGRTAVGESKEEAVSRAKNWSGTHFRNTTGRQQGTYRSRTTICPSTRRRRPAFHRLPRLVRTGPRRTPGEGRRARRQRGRNGNLKRSNDGRWSSGSGERLHLLY